MNALGRFLQVCGLLGTGFAAVAAFFIDVTEGFFITVGLGGFAVFILGGLLSGRSA